MARGYPTREEDAPPPMPEGLLPEETCVICKRRRAVGGRYCPSCKEALRDDA